MLIGIFPSLSGCLRNRADPCERLGPTDDRIPSKDNTQKAFLMMPESYMDAIRAYVMRQVRIAHAAAGDRTGVLEEGTKSGWTSEQTVPE